MGMRLESPVTLTVELKNMISEAVTNGTVQVTPAGPIVLLKYRQTVGGYPRVFSVISADVDLLAQYVPGQKIRFRKISIEEAWRAAHEKRAYIVSLRRRFSAF
jgi:antagonist of KipI